VNIDLDQALRCAKLTLAVYRGRTPPPRLVAHCQHLELLAATGCEPETPKPVQTQDWCTSTEAAAILGCSPQYVRRPTVAHSLGGQRVSGSFWVFNKREVEDYAAQRSTP
jgi:excisionase family DNA binding protein